MLGPSKVDAADSILNPAISSSLAIVTNTCIYKFILNIVPCKHTSVYLLISSTQIIVVGRDYKHKGLRPTPINVSFSPYSQMPILSSLSLQCPFFSPCLCNIHLFLPVSTMPTLSSLFLHYPPFPPCLYNAHPFLPVSTLSALSPCLYNAHPFLPVSTIPALSPCP
jgi:hypothetical protein